MDEHEVQLTPDQHVLLGHQIRLDVHRLATDPQWQRVVSVQPTTIGRNSSRPLEYAQGAYVKVCDEKKRWDGPYVVLGWKGDTPLTRMYLVEAPGAPRAIWRAWDFLAPYQDPEAIDCPLEHVNYVQDWEENSKPTLI